MKLITPRRIQDDRGWFVETYNDRWFRQQGVDAAFRQDNHSLSRQAGVLRGLHFQRPPHAQAKLVRCIAGSIWDVAVDIRVRSPTFGRWVGVTLTADDGNQLFIPAGFAHGFVTLAADTEVVYKVDDYYSPECDAGIAWNDPEIAVSWPTGAQDVVLSAKDSRLPLLAEIESPFPYDGRPLKALEQRV